MNVLINRASDWEYQEAIEIKTMAELTAFIEANGTLIIEKPDSDIYGKEYDLRIVIYDDYME